MSISNNTMDITNIQIENKLLNFLHDAELLFSYYKNVLVIHVTKHHLITIKNQQVFTWDSFIEALYISYPSSVHLKKLLDSYIYYEGTVQPFIDYGVIKTVTSYEYI